MWEPRRPTATVDLDSWAVLRHLENAEPSASLVAGLLDDQRPLLSWINLGEIIDARLPDERVVFAVTEHARLWTGDPELRVAGASRQWRDIRNTA